MSWAHVVSDSFGGSPVSVPPPWDNDEAEQPTPRGPIPGTRRALRPTPAWVDYASCRGAPTSIFYRRDDDLGKVNDRFRYQQALAVCADCPVRAACLEHAIAMNETLGVWGGLIPSERIKYARRLRRMAGQ